MLTIIPTIIGYVEVIPKTKNNIVTVRKLATNETRPAFALTFLSRNASTSGTNTHPDR